MKRALDIAVAAVALFFLLPVLLLVSLLVAIRLGRPVLFSQPRPGLGGVVFTLKKFRTMTDECDGNGKPLPDDERVTRLGQFLRSRSLDELPTLLSVLRGDMSLVGPRPLLVRYLDRYTPEQARRHDVQPGMTGWAQINGRNAISWEEKFDLDVWYVYNRTFMLDLKILATTAIRVLRRDNISAESHVTMPEFLGTSVSDDGSDH